METKSNRYWNSGIYNLFGPLQSLTATIACINNDVFIATTQEIEVGQESGRRLAAWSGAYDKDL